MKCGAAALVCALALSMVPAATAAPTWQGMLTAESLDAEAAEASAALLALVRYDDTGDAPMASSQFTIAAQAVHVETQRADPVVVPPSGGADVPANPSPSHQDHEAATILGVANRATYRLEILALEGHAPPQVTMSKGCIQLEPSDRTAAQSEPKVNPTRTLEVDVSSAVKAHACAEGSVLRVTDSFLVVLWEWDAQLLTDAGSVELRSGYDRSDTDTTGLLFPGVAKSRQQYLIVTKGELSMPMDASPHYAFLDNPSLDATGTVAFRNAVGELHHGEAAVSLDAEALRLSGQLSLGLANQGQALHVALTGALDGAEADGRPLAVGLATAPSAPAWPWLLPLALLAWPARRLALRLRAKARLRTAAMLRPEDARRVEELCSAVLDRYDWGLARYVRARARLQMADLDGAHADLQAAWARLSGGSRDREAVALQAFLVCQSLGLESERDTWLKRWRGSF